MSASVELTEFEHPAEVTCPGGPLLVRGMGREVTDDEGVVHLTTRPVSALCRCARSAIKPWCDGTHKLLAARGSSG